MVFGSIGDFLKRFQHIEPSDKHIKDAFIAVVSELFNETIEPNELEVQNGTIYLRVHPALKSEIYIKKARTLELVNKKLEGQTLKNII